ncbi:putative gonadotropin-releasing hormone II receptor isoform X2 [Bacillus rossius redtenbacheri]|uniref:putative gonadotropin-releasing hormone II receptor isoform X2 n=1 Tax=Bacillus rossius redtenbacheri TaxID=93214 RepID=UPI002FDE3CC1
MLGPVRACPNLLRAMLLLAVPAVGANSSRAWRVLPIEDCGGNATNSSGEGVSCLEHAPSLTSSSATKAAVLAVLAFLSLVGNAWTIWSIQREGRAVARRHVGAVYALILHLSVADLLVSVCCLGGEAAWSYTVQWLAGDAACKLFKFLQMFSLYLSTFVLVLIGVDRFVVVRYPMKSLGTSGRLNKAIVFSWALSFLLSTPQLVIFRVMKGPFYEDFEQCVTYGFYTEPWQEYVYAAFSLLFMFVLPLLVLLATYVCTVATIARSEKVFRAEVAAGGSAVASELNRKRLIHRAKMKSMRISVVIVATFIVWWTPYYTMMIVLIFLSPDKQFSEELKNGIFFFGMSNSLVNPLIYGAFHLWRPKRRKGGSNSMYYYSRDGSVQQQQRSLVATNSTRRPRGSSTSLLISTPKERAVGVRAQDKQTLLTKPAAARNGFDA